MHVVRMLLLDTENALYHDTGSWILIREVAHKFSIMLDGDTFRDQVFLDHVDEVFAFERIAMRLWWRDRPD